MEAEQEVPPSRQRSVTASRHATCWMGHRVAAWQKRVPENGQLITNYGAMYINKYHFLNNPPYL